MTASSNLAESVLDALGIAVLRRTGERRYELYGQPPELYFRLFPEESRQGCAAPWNSSPMLNFFLSDAEMFFARNSSGVLASCFWQEDSAERGEYALAVFAICAGDDKAIVIRFLSGGHIDKASLLQKARKRSRADRDADTLKFRIDAQTALPDRNSFMESLMEEMERVPFTGGDLSLLLLDIDDFEGIKDVYGPSVGDEVISALGKMLPTLLRQGDVVARYGEKKFAVLALHTMRIQTIRMAEKLRNAISEHSFGSLPPVTVSIGCAIYSKGETPESFLQRADLALCEATSDGKNMVRLR